MKSKFISLICITAILYSFAACSSTDENPANAEIPKTAEAQSLNQEQQEQTKPPKATEALTEKEVQIAAKTERKPEDNVVFTTETTTTLAPSRTVAPSTTATAKTVDLPTPTVKSTIEEFKAFLENEEIRIETHLYHESPFDGNIKEFNHEGKKGDDIRSDIFKKGLIPANRFMDYELDYVSFNDNKGNSWGNLYFQYINPNYIEDSRLDPTENSEKSRASITVSFTDEGLEFSKEIVNDMLKKGYELIKIDGKEIYYIPAYALSDSKILLAHCYSYVNDSKRIRVWLPEVDGLNEYDMVKYLEMIPIS